MATRKEATTSSVSFPALLGLAFIILKLTHHIDWSWWWVLSPFWLPLAIMFVIAFVCLIIYVVISAIENNHERKKELNGER